MARKAAVDPVATPAPATTNYPTITDEATIAAMVEHRDLARSKNAAEKRLRVLKALIEAKMAGAPCAMAGDCMAILTAVPALPPLPDRTITRAMVGQVLPGNAGRVGYTQLTVR